MKRSKLKILVDAAMTLALLLLMPYELDWNVAPRDDRHSHAGPVNCPSCAEP